MNKDIERVSTNVSMFVVPVLKRIEARQMLMMRWQIATSIATMLLLFLILVIK